MQGSFLGLPGIGVHMRETYSLLIMVCGKEPTQIADKGSRLVFLKFVWDSMDEGGNMYTPPALHASIQARLRCKVKEAGSMPLSYFFCGYWL